MAKQEQIDIANKVYDYIGHGGHIEEWLTTTTLWKHTSPDMHWQSFVNILNALYHNEVLVRKGSYRLEWKLPSGAVWDRRNPFGKHEPRYYKKNETPEKEPYKEFKPSREDYQPAPAPLLEDLNKKIQEALAPIAQNQAALQKVMETMQGEYETLQREKMQLEINLRKVELLAQQSVKEIRIEIPPQETVELEGPAHPKLELALKLATARIPILLIGPTGSGKSFLAGQIADALTLQFSCISCSSGMSESHFLGRFLPIGDGQHVPAEYATRFEKGGVMLLDELDASDANTLLPINNSLSNGYLSLPNRPKKPIAHKHQDFIPIGAANTVGTGADRMYVGRNQLDEAFLDRFRMGQIFVDYDRGLETALCPDEELRETLWKYRDNITKAKLRRVVSTRFLKDSYKAKKIGLTVPQIEEALFHGWRTEEIEKAKGNF